MSEEFNRSSATRRWPERESCPLTAPQGLTACIGSVAKGELPLVFVARVRGHRCHDERAATPHPRLQVNLMTNGPPVKPLLVALISGHPPDPC